MAATISTDVVIPEVYSDYLVEDAVTKTDFYRSGMVQRSPLIDSLISSGGSVVNIPFWQNLSGADEAIQNNTDLARTAITADKQRGVRLVRGKNFAWEDLARTLAGEDIQTAIERGLSQYWGERQQASLSSIIQGVIADNVANDSGDLVNDITTAGAVADAHKISSGAVIDAYSKLGDKSEFSVIVMHSVPYYRLVSLNLIDFEPTNTQNIGFGVYLGMTVVVNDNVPTPTVTNLQYWTIISKLGAFGYGENTGDQPAFEIDRDASAGVSEVITRRNYILHPMGFDFLSGTLANQTPTNTELETTNNWNRVYDKKNCGFVVLKTNG